MRSCLESAGIEFTEENGGGPGVRLKKTSKETDVITRAPNRFKRSRARGENRVHFGGAGHSGRLDAVYLLDGAQLVLRNEPNSS